MKTCLVCGNPSGNCKFCRACTEEKHNAGAVVSQNAKKLAFLLGTRRLTTAGYEKFLLYTENIKKGCKVLMKFKTADELRQLIVINHLK